VSAIETKKPELRSPDARRAFWLRQYAAAFANRDKRAAAVALQFAQSDQPPTGSGDVKQQRG
jgi:hypothetical protein